MLGSEPPRERADDVVVRAAFAGRIDRLRRELEVLVGARGIEVVVLEEHRRRQDDVGMARGVGHELLVHADEQIVAGKTAPHRLLVRRDHHRVGVLDQHRPDRAAALQRLAVAGQDRPEATHVEPPHALVPGVEALDQRLVEPVDGARGVQRAAALVRPRAGDGGNAERGVHVGRAVALAREAVAEAEERALVPPDQRREGLDLLDG